MEPRVSQGIIEHGNIAPNNFFSHYSSHGISKVARPSFPDLKSLTRISAARAMSNSPLAIIHHGSEQHASEPHGGDRRTPHTPPVSTTIRGQTHAVEPSYKSRSKASTSYMDSSKQPRAAKANQTPPLSSTRGGMIPGVSSISRLRSITIHCLARVTPGGRSPVFTLARLAALFMNEDSPPHWECLTQLCGIEHAKVLSERPGPLRPWPRQTPRR